HDNLIEVEYQFIADRDGNFPASFARVPITSVTALFEQYRNLVEDLAWQPADILRFVLRLMRYTTSSSIRRQNYYETISWLKFLTLRRLDRPGGEDKLNYSQQFVDVLCHAPKALVAMDAAYSDARTQGNISAQLA